MAIRRYADEDVDGVLDTWYGASLVAHFFLPNGFFEAERREIAAHWMPMADTIVFEADEAVVGFLSLIGNEVGAIFVAPEHQGRGVGRALMDSARATRPFLELGVFELNSQGRRFYDADGFELVGRQLDQATGQVELRLRLGRDDALPFGSHSSDDAFDEGPPP